MARSRLAERFFAVVEAREFSGDGDKRADDRSGLRRASFRRMTGSCARTSTRTSPNGANMVEYWHWASIAANQETYWKGDSVARPGAEPRVCGDEPDGARAGEDRPAPGGIEDSQRRGDFVEPRLGERHQLHALWRRRAGAKLDGEPDGYASVVQQMHKSLYDLNVGSDFVFPDDAGFSQYKLLIVPALYISDDALLQRISDYVKNGGHVVMTFKSGFANENSAVRWVRAPGRLREAAGISYQEFSNLEKPLALKDDPFHVGDDNQVSLLGRVSDAGACEGGCVLRPSVLRQVAGDHRERVRQGDVALRGNVSFRRIADGLAAAARWRRRVAVGADQQLPAAVHVQHGVNQMGKRVHYYFNYSGEEAKVSYGYGAGTSLLDGKAVTKGAQLTLAPWDLAIVEE